jgi:hypothetical protein
MEYEFSFMEGSDLLFDFTDIFVEALTELKQEHRVQVASQLYASCKQLPEADDQIQEAAGIISDKDGDVFFKAIYVKSEGHPAVYLDMEVIGIDEYLDLMNENRLLKK